jgi:hypothetical protein
VSSSRSFRLLGAVSLLVTQVVVAEGQSSVVVSPFVSYIPSATSNPLAGFALTFGGTTGLALRSGAEISISKPDSTIPGHYRPWGADADAMLFLGGLGGGATVFSRSLAPYVFTGIGLVGGDSAGKNNVSHGWSYGLGATLPLGLDADLFAEARWRMTQYVLPTSNGAPDSKSGLRFGLSFHVGGGSAEPPRRSPPRRRQRVEYEDDEEYVVAQPQVIQAPPPQVVVVQQAPPPPQQVVVVQQEPEPSTQVNINLPGTVVTSGRRSRSSRVYVVGSSCSRSHRGCSSSQRRYDFEVRAPQQQNNVIQMRSRPLPTVVRTTTTTTRTQSQSRVTSARQVQSRVITTRKTNARERAKKDPE